METKPGYKTTEFWLSLIAIAIGVFVASGATELEGPAAQSIGILESALVALGYPGARLTLKNSG